MKIQMSKLYYKLLVLIVLGTLFQSYLKYINIFLVLGCISLIIVDLLKNRVAKSNVVILFSVITVFAIALFNTEMANLSYIKDRGIYYIFIILVCMKYFSAPDEFVDYFRKDAIFVDRVIKLWNFLVFISIFNPHFYKSLDEISGWGSEKFFFSYTAEGGARLAADCCMYMAIVLIRYIITEKKRYLLYLLVPTYTLITSGSRIYLIVCMCIMVMAFYVYLGDDVKFWLLIVPFMLMAVVVVLNSSMGDKFKAVQDADRIAVMGKLDAFSNGRFKPIKLCVQFFSEIPIINKVFGNGFGVIETTVKTWSFNDFVELLITYGVSGLVIYVYCMVNTIKSVLKSKLPLYIKLLPAASWFAVAMISMFFRTTTTVLCFVIFCGACRAYKNINTNRVRT